LPRPAAAHACLLALILAEAAVVLPVQAQTPDLTLDVPGDPIATFAQQQAMGSYALPTAPARQGVVAVIIGEGQVTRAAFRIDTGGLSSLQLIAPLRAQLQQAGFSVVLDCAAAACGGFDFRFGTEVIAPPDMHVDLGDFHFLSARRDGDQPELVGILSSRTATAGFVQIIRVGPRLDAPLTQPGTAALVPGGLLRAPDAPMPDAPVPDAIAAAPLDIDGFAARLEGNGSLVLDGLAFPTGSAQLAEDDFPGLRALADYLLANPDRQVALVGHTDSEGSLDGNIALSRRRAGSVLERLAARYGVPRSQMEAQGMGYLAPRASNLTPQGREQNRRVEVIVTSTN